MGFWNPRAICPACGGKIHTQQAFIELRPRTGKRCQHCGVALTGKVTWGNEGVLADPDDGSAGVTSSVPTHRPGYDPQQRIEGMVRRATECGPLADEVVTPLLLIRYVAIVRNMKLPGGMSVVRDVDGYRFTRDMTPEQDRDWRSLMGPNPSVERARAAAALALGFTPKDVLDLEDLAREKSRDPDGLADLLAWAAEFRRLEAAARQSA